MAGTPVSGLEGRVVYGAVSLNAGKWDVTPEVGDIPSTNFESAGYEEGVTGIAKCDFTVEMFFDKSLPPFVAPLTLTPGVKVTALKLYVSRTSNRFFNFPSWRLLGTPVTQDVDNKLCMVTIKGKSNGIFYYPLS